MYGLFRYMSFRAIETTKQSPTKKIIVIILRLIIQPHFESQASLSKPPVSHTMHSHETLVD